MLRVLIIYSIVIGYAVSAQKTCTKISRCPMDQCCYRPSHIFSKRKGVYGGVCQPFRQIGEPCDGPCGCAQGLTCYYSDLINSTGGICVQS